MAGTAGRYVGLIVAIAAMVCAGGCPRSVSNDCGCDRKKAAHIGPESVRRADTANELGDWRATDFVGAGEVYARDGSIILEKGDELTGITWAGGELAKVDYEIRLEAMRVEGEDFFCALTFPVKADHCSLIVGGWRGKVVGLSNIDLMDAAENDTTVLMDFETGRWYEIRVRVTSDRIRAWVDSDEVVNVGIAERIVGVRYEVEACRPLGIATYKTTGAIRGMRLSEVGESGDNRLDKEG
jgi:hypothetical protein